MSHLCFISASAALRLSTSAPGNNYLAGAHRAPAGRGPALPDQGCVSRQPFPGDWTAPWSPGCLSGRRGDKRWGRVSVGQSQGGPQQISPERGVFRRAEPPWWRPGQKGKRVGSRQGKNGGAGKEDRGGRLEGEEKGGGRRGRGGERSRWVRPSRLWLKLGDLRRA